MAQAKYKWDIEGLNASLNRLKQEKETLEDNVSFLRNIESEVQTNWQSVAGEIYSNKVGIDIENYLQIIKELQQKIEALDKIANQVYQNCEDNVRSKVSAMAAQITAI